MVLNTNNNILLNPMRGDPFRASKQNAEDMGFTYQTRLKPNMTP